MTKESSAHTFFGMNGIIAGYMWYAWDERIDSFINTMSLSTLRSLSYCYSPAFLRPDPGSELTPSWWLGESWPLRETIHSHWAFSSLAGHIETENTLTHHPGQYHQPMVRSHHQWQVSSVDTQMVQGHIIERSQGDMMLPSALLKMSPPSWTIARCLVTGQAQGWRHWAPNLRGHDYPKTK